MATMTFERIVPSGKNAYFPFQMSAAGLNPIATVFINDDAAAGSGSPHSTVSSGVTVVDLGGGLYALKVLSTSMTADTVYYGVVTKGAESVRIPMFAYAPANHVAQVLADLAVVDGVVDGIAAELGDVSAQTFNGISAPATMAAALATVFNKVDGVQADLDNATDGLGALKTLIETETTAIDSALTTIDNEIAALQTDVTAILADTNELQGDWANGGRLDALLDRTVAASEAAEDLIGLATDSASDATVFGKVAKLAGDVAVVDGNVDSIKASIENGTYGLSALETKVMTVDTVVDGIAASLADGTTGLAALKAEIDANEAKLDTIDGVVDGLATEIGDVSAVFAGGPIAGTPATVAEGLKKIYDNLASSDVWDDNLSSYTTAGTAGYLLREAHEELTDAGHGLAAIKAETASIQDDTTALLVDTTSIISKLGTPAGASMSADISAIKAVVDTLQVSVNARLVPSVPSEVYSSAEAIRVKFSLNIHDGETGALEDPDVVGTNGAAQGQALIAAKTVGGGSDPVLYDAASAGNVLGTTNAAGLSGYSMMTRKGTGRFEAFAELPAYFNKSVEVQFLCYDSDPVAAQQTFTSSRFMVVRSPIQATFAGGAF